jgi:hypothetical protein
MLFFILSIVVVLALFLQKAKVPAPPPHEPPAKLNQASWPFPSAKNHDKT